MQRLLLLTLAAAFAATAQATFMNENISTYYDSHYDGTNVYGYSSVNAGLSIHQHQIKVQITSPLGRVSQGGNNGYVGGFTDWSQFISWNPDDYGSYGVSYSIYGHCTQSGVNFSGPGNYQQVTPTPPPCTDPSTATCSEANQIAPLGHLLRGYPQCKRSTHCCTADNLNYIDGWCRVESCSKCGQAYNSLQAMCFGSQANCEDTSFQAFCINMSTCNGK